MDAVIFVWLVESDNSMAVAVVDCADCRSAAVGHSRIRTGRSCDCWGSTTWTDRVFVMGWAVMDCCCNYYVNDDVMCAGERTGRLLIGKPRWRL